ncbi:MAG: hypothetical protein HWD58_15745 [Bacteroidota bacterium]|nr:MAG: hypothetical protein HWD58_15745 [Bacteroidota bacterium]
MINLLSGSGNNYHTGVFSKFTNGGGNLTGKWNEFSGTIGNGNHIGVFNNFFTGGNGIQAGLYTWMNSGMTGTGVQYGTYAANSSSGSRSSFGSYNFWEAQEQALKPVNMFGLTVTTIPRIKGWKSC